MIGNFFAILFNGLFALGCCVYDMYKALRGDSKMDRFRRDDRFKM